MVRRFIAGALSLGLAFGCAADKPEPVAVEPAPAPTGCLPGELEEGNACLAPGVGSCGEGFTANDGACDAILPSSPCESGTLALPGDAFCREPAPCGDGTWGDIPLEPDTVFVDGAHVGPESGAATAPWRTIAAALEAVRPGGMIAIAPGSYPEALTIANKPVRLWGKCSAAVQVGRAGATTFLVRDGADGSELHSLGIGGTLGVVNGGSRGLLLHRVWIHDTASRGVSTESALGEASTRIVGSLIERASDVGVFATGASVTVEGSVIRGTVPANGSGRGLSVRGGSTLTLRGSVVEGSHDLGVLVSGSSGHIETTLIRDTAPLAGLSGGGLAFQPDSATGVPATGDVTDVVIERAHTYGVLLHGSTATLTRVSIRDVGAQPLDGAMGVGLQAQADDVTGALAFVTVEQLTVERTHYGGVSLSGAEVNVRRLLVRDIYPEPRSQAFGRGVLAFFDRSTGQGVTGALRGVRIERAVEAGLFAQGVSLTLEDAVVAGTFPRPDGAIGRGISVQSEDATLGSSLALRRVWLVDNRDAGLILEGTTATLEDVTVEGTAATFSEGRFGDAIQIITEAGLPPASATIVRAHIARSERAGIAAYGAEVSLSASVLECNPIDLNGQRIGARDFVFVDAGDNRCACGDEVRPCRVLSHDLEPPSPLP